MEWLQENQRDRVMDLTWHSERHDCAGNSDVPACAPPWHFFGWCEEGMVQHMRQAMRELALTDIMRVGELAKVVPDPLNGTRTLLDVWTQGHPLLTLDARFDLTTFWARVRALGKETDDGTATRKR